MFCLFILFVLYYLVFHENTIFLKIKNIFFFYLTYCRYGTSSISRTAHSCNRTIIIEIVFPSFFPLMLEPIILVRLLTKKSEVFLCISISKISSFIEFNKLSSFVYKKSIFSIFVHLFECTPGCIYDCIL